MRIIAGEAGGRRLKSMKTDKVRPTLDRVKEAVFNIIYNRVLNARGLDLFAGFGSLGLEAISRGAQSVDFVEINFKHAEIIKKNIEICGFSDRSRLYKRDVFNFLEENRDTDYDLIFMDPPYGKNFIKRALKMIGNKQLLAEGGLIIAEQHKNDKIIELQQFTPIKDRNYGDTVIKIFKNRRDV